MFVKTTDWFIFFVQGNPLRVLYALEHATFEPPALFLRFQQVMLKTLGCNGHNKL